MDFCAKKTTIRVILTLLLALLVGISMTGETVDFHQGLGWDGQWYFAVCRDFLHNILNHTYDTYRLQRILPFAFINVVLTLFGIAPTISICMDFINVMNSLMILLGVFMYMKISDHLKLSLPVEIFGFAALFLNYPVLKLAGYYPFLTDTFALSLAICLVYFFVCQRKIPISLIIIGAFVWPTLLVMGLVLAYLPSQSIFESDPISKRDNIELQFIKIMFMSAVPVCACILFAAIYIKFGSSIGFKRLYNGESYTNLYMFALSLICVVMYFAYMLRPVHFSPRKQIKTFISLLQMRNVIAFVAIFIGTHAFINYISDGTALVPTWKMILLRIVIPPSVDPFVFIVTSFMYFGPFIFFLLYYWKEMVRIVSKMGYSYFILVFMGVIMLINTESRHLTAFLPILVIPVLHYLNEDEVNNLTMLQSLLFLLISLVVSRFWYHINVPGIEAAFADHLLTQFPAQRYFMSHGPWMSHQMYLIFLMVTLISGGLFILFQKNFKKKAISPYLA